MNTTINSLSMNPSCPMTFSLFPPQKDAFIIEEMGVAGEGGQICSYSGNTLKVCTQCNRKRTDKFNCLFSATGDFFEKGQ